DAYSGKGAAANLRFHPAVEPWGRTIHWPLVTGIVTVLVLAIVAYVYRGPLFAPSAKKAAVVQPLSLAILPFSNADTLVWGQYAKFGGQIRIDATLQDLKHVRSVPIKIEAVDEKDIPGAVDRLAASIRNNLAFSPDVIKELQASSFQPSSKDASALRDFSQGVQLLRDGKNLDAVKKLQAAIQEDPQFAFAYSRLAEADSELGYDTQAEQASRKALDLSQQLPLAEKYLIEANHTYIMKDNQKAIS